MGRQVSVYLEKELLVRLDKLQEESGRSRSFIISKLLNEAMNHKESKKES